MKILFVGHGRAGKDEAVLAAAEATGLKPAGTFSRHLLPFVARELGVEGDTAYLTRHLDRETWRRIGDEVRAEDPCRLCRLAFAAGDISGGVRAQVEIDAIRAEGLADLIVWIERDVPPDPTLEFGPEVADCIVTNNGTLEEFRCKIHRLLSRPPCTP